MLSYKTLAALGVLALLSGCGFKPLYGTDSATHAPAASAHLAAIEIPVMPDRIGQELRNLLIDSLHPGGPSGDFRYRLNIGVREADINLGLQQNASSTRGQVRITVEYFLIDEQTGKTLLHQTVRDSTGYNILVNEFGSVLSADDARQRGLQEISEELTTQLALYFTAS